MNKQGYLFMSKTKFTLGDLVVERDIQYPFFWLVKRDGEVIDRDQYSNDIRTRFEIGVYNKNTCTSEQ